MPFKVDVIVEDNKFRTYVIRLEATLLAAQKEAMQEARKEISSYIKNTLLNGSMFKDTTGLPRSNSTTSLKPGLLRKSVFATQRTTADNGEQIAVGIRNLEGSNAVLIANILRFGSTNHPLGWDIVATKVKSLHFFEHLIKQKSGQYFGSDEVFAAKVHHPGMEGKDFINQAFVDKRSYVIDLVRSKMRKASQKVE